MSKLVKVLKILRGFFPSKLPVGVTELEAWVDDIIDTYSLPTQDKRSTKFVLLATLVNFGGKVSHKSKFYFYLHLHAAATTQVASALFYELKQQQMEEQKAKALKEAEEASKPALTV